MAPVAQPSTTRGDAEGSHDVPHRAYDHAMQPDTPAVTVLGEVVLRNFDGDEVMLSPQKREILAALAAAAGAKVTTEHFVTALWGADTAATRNRLKAQVARLRPLLDRGLSIEFRNGGYQLCGPLQLLDSTRFESMVVEARDCEPKVAIELYAQAIALWTGAEPYTNVTNPLVDASGWRLVALRDSVVLALADLEITTGTHPTSLPLLASAFMVDPARSDIAGRFAHLLTVAGRDVEGLRTIQRHREAVARTGAVIGPDVTDLEGRILRHEVSHLPFPPPVVLSHHFTSSPIGWAVRDSWLARLESAVALGAVILCGEPGVGKTSLTRSIEHRHAMLGAPTIRCAALPQPHRAMDVIVSIIEQLQHLTAPSSVGSVLPVALSRAPTRDALVADLAELVGGLLDRTDPVLIIEDCHWLDRISADVIGAVLDRPGRRIVMTTRRPLLELFGDRWTETPTIDLPALSRPEVEQVIHQLLPLRSSDQLAADLFRQTGGNALFLNLALDTLTHSALGRETPLSIQAAVATRTSALSQAARDVLDIAALLGQRFPLAPLQRMRLHAVELLETAQAEGLVQLSATGESGEFVHGLVADALTNMLPAGARVNYHDALTGALQAAGMPAVAIAVQALGAAELDPARAVGVCRDAMVEHATVFDWDSLVLLGQRALEITRMGSHDRRIDSELHMLTGTGLRRLGRAGSEIELFRAAELAEECADGPLLVRTVTELCLHGPTTQAGAVDDRALRHLGHALIQATDADARAELLASAATLLAVSNNAERGRAMYLEAHQLAMDSLDPHVTRRVLMNAHLGLDHPDDIELRRVAATRLGEFADPEAMWESRFLQFGLGLIDADLAVVERCVTELRQITPFVRERPRDRGLLQVESAYAHICGDFDAAEAFANDALRTCLESYSESWAMAVYCALIFPIREAQGRVAELSGALSLLLAGAPDFITWHAIDAFLGQASNDQDRVERELAYLRTRRLDLVPDLTWTAVASMVCRPIWSTKDHGLATALRADLSPYSGQMTWNGLSTHGPVDNGLALLAATVGDTEAVAKHVAIARSLVERIGAPHLLWAELSQLDTL